MIIEKETDETPSDIYKRHRNYHDSPKNRENFEKGRHFEKIETLC